MYQIRVFGFESKFSNRIQMGSTENLSKAEKSSIIKMAWEDRTPIGAIEYQYDLGERQTIALMRKELTSSS